MEKFIYLYQVPTLQKVTIESLYVEPGKFMWYQQLCDRKNDSIVLWLFFIDELISHHRYIMRNIFFSYLIKLKKRGLVTKHI
jgi:hypothetical protein